MKNNKSATDIKINKFLIQFTLTNVISFTVLIGIVTLSIYQSLNQTIQDEDDRTLSDKIYLIKKEIINMPSAENELLIINRYDTRDHDDLNFLKISKKDGKDLVISSHTINKEILSIAHNLFPQKNYFEKFQNITLKDGRLFRFLNTTVKTKWGQEYYIIAGTNRTADEKLLNRYRRKIYYVLFIASCLIAFLGFWLAKKAIKPIEESIKQLTQFSDDLAHELRSPLNNLMGEMEIVLTKERNINTYIDTLGSSLEELDRMKVIIESLLFITRGDANVIKQTFEDFYIYEELSKVIDFFTIQAEDKKIKIKIDIGDKDFLLNANKTLFQQAIGNILSNAIKYASTNGEVLIKVFKNLNHCFISIKDNGEGIDLKDQNFIFDRFYRVDSSRTRNKGGVGLGLAITKSIAKIHNGNITVNSSIGNGAEFTISFKQNYFKNT